jgi:3-isopropylmalate dehydrogenase
VSPQYRLGCLLGDGIGPEIVPAARKVLDAAMSAYNLSPIEWHDLPMGASALAQFGTPMPEQTKLSLETLDGWLIGPHDSASYPPEWHLRRERPPGGELRHHFQLFANLRPSRNRPGIAAVGNDVDILTVRENLEGFYADRNMVNGSGELQPTEDVVLVVGVFTRPRIEQIAVVAFEAARKRRQHLTIIHKSNVIPVAFEMFLRICREVGEDFPDVNVDDYLFDAFTAHLVRHPERFDVVLAENMFGDVLTDLIGELVGGLGMSPSLNASHHHAMAQAAHGSAPDIAGMNIANPSGMILSAAMLAEWIGERRSDLEMVKVAELIESAVDATLSSSARTVDLGGNLGTTEFADTVVAMVSDWGAK